MCIERQTCLDRTTYLYLYMKACISFYAGNECTQVHIDKGYTEDTIHRKLGHLFNHESCDSKTL